MKLSKPFIHSVYCSSVRTSASGSAWAANVASGVHHCWQIAQPLPLSQASKNFLAIVVIEVIADTSCLAIVPADSELSSQPVERQPQRHSTVLP
jgi:hypothetical protein